MNRKELVTYVLDLTNGRDICRKCKYKNKKTNGYLFDGCTHERCKKTILDYLESKDLLKDEYFEFYLQTLKHIDNYRLKIVSDSIDDDEKVKG